MCLYFPIYSYSDEWWTTRRCCVGTLINDIIMSSVIAIIPSHTAMGVLLVVIGRSVQKSGCRYGNYNNNVMAV